MKSFSHERTTRSNEWYTPKFILDAIGPFDLDPCSPELRPFPTAAHHLTLKDDGLTSPWTGRVWLNPPYGRQTALWLEKLAKHNHGTALVFARTDTQMFHQHVFGKAKAILWLKGRIKFFNHQGEAAFNCGAPSCLIAYGLGDAVGLEQSGLKGHQTWL